MNVRPTPCDYEYANTSMHMTHRWLDRGMKRFDSTDPMYGYDQTFFPIVQGSTYEDLRKQSAECIARANREGNAIGGPSVGEPAEKMYEMTDLVCKILPTEKLRYLMGVDTPANILECIALGVDMFDCVMPARNARNGMLYTTQGIINIRNERWKEDSSPVDLELSGYVSSFYSKAYLRHLIISNEILGSQIASIQNLSFYLWPLGEARTQILNNNFTNWKDQILTVISQRS